MTNTLTTADNREQRNFFKIAENHMEDPNGESKTCPTYDMLKPRNDPKSHGGFYGRSFPKSNVIVSIRGIATNIQQRTTSSNILNTRNNQKVCLPSDIPFHMELE